MDQGSERKESPHECAGKYHCEGCFIAEVDNRRVRMITTTRYARSAWVGMVIGVEMGPTSASKLNPPGS